MQKCFSSPEHSYRLWNTPGFVFKEGSGASAQLKRSECEVDQTSPSSDMRRKAVSPGSDQPLWFTQGQIYCC